MVSNIVNNDEITLCFLGNSHIDVAWIWPTSETKKVVLKTFLSVINTLRKHNATYAQSTTLYYYWLSQEHPRILDEILRLMHEGKWEVVGGTWVENDFLIPSGESLVRQLLYGEKYIKRIVGKYVDITWFPDSFGFPSTLPQILNKANIKFMIIQKLNWNDAIMFPYNIFWWESADGSKVLVYQSIGGYAEDPSRKDFEERIKEYVKLALIKQGLKDILILYGLGDHGGGINDDMIKAISKLSEKLKPMNIKIRHCSAKEYFNKILNKYRNIPTYKGELYLQFHRGTYTSQVKIKELIKRCEYLLEVLEKILTIRYLVKGKPYSRDKINKIWMDLLQSQFHDVASGSLSKSAYEEYRNRLTKLMRTLKEEVFNVLNDLIHSNGSNVGREVILVFNPTPRTKVIKVCRSDCGCTKVSISGLSIKTIKEGKSCVKNEDRTKANILNEEIVLENKYLRIAINKDTGHITSIFSKELQTEFIKGAAFLELYDDKPNLARAVVGRLDRFYDYFFDAWEVYYLQQGVEGVKSFRLSRPKNVVLEKLSDGSSRVSIIYDVVCDDSSSRIIHELILHPDKEYVEGVVRADWRCKHKLLKYVINLNIWSDKYVVGQPYGYVVRRNPASPYSSLYDRAQWEAWFNTWIDYNDGNKGLAFITSSRFGYDLMGSTLRITILRAPRYPPEYGIPWTPENLEKQDFIELENHEVKYYILPHKGNHEDSEIPLVAEELTKEPIVIKVKGSPEKEIKILDIEPPITVSALKISEENNNDIVIRLVNYLGRDINVRMKLHSNEFIVDRAFEANLLEEVIDSDDVRIIGNNEIEVRMHKYEIKTLILRVKPKSGLFKLF